jgi:hypothetical protein
MTAGVAPTCGDKPSDISTWLPCEGQKRSKTKAADALEEIVPIRLWSIFGLFFT